VPNQFDNIEDSLRNTFEGFELPVNDTDWAAIEKGIISDTKKPGFWAIITNKNNRKWLLGGILLVFLGLSYTIFNHNSASKSVLQKPVVSNTEKAGTVAQKVNEVKPKLNQQDNAANISGSNKQVSGTMNSVNGEPTSSRSPKQNIVAISPKGAVNQPISAEIKSNTTSIATTHADAKPVTAKVVIAEPVNRIETSKPTESGETEMGEVTTLALNKPMGIFSVPTLSPFNKPKTVNFDLPKPHLGWEWFAAVQSNFESNNAKSTGGSPVWGGVLYPNLKYNQLNLRFEAGSGYRFRNFSIGAGFAFETGAYQQGTDDTIRIQIPTKTLKYTTLQGEDFWLIQKSRDSIIIIHRQPKRQWIEVPFYFTQRFALGHHYNLTLGATLNPGFMVGSTGEMVNPYAFGNVGFSSPYEYGKDKLTLTNTISANTFTNKFRLGNGLQLGIEKEIGMINFGLQIQTKYYYTPVFKSGVPLQLNTFNYGINARIGVKF
jgi:hypothetical protein